MLSQQEIDTHHKYVIQRQCVVVNSFPNSAASLNFKNKLQVFYKRFLDLVSSGNLPAVDDLIDIVVRFLVVELFHVEHAGYVVL
jgi:hypothetical protein